MPTNRNIDSILRQLETCRDTGQMRKLLKEASACSECREAPSGADGREAYCSCRRRFRVWLQNTLVSIHKG